MKANLSKKYPYILILTVVILYGNTLRNGFVLDDDVVFLKNNYVQSGVQSIPAILSHGFLYGFNQKNDQSYRPLVLIVFANVKEIFGNNPFVLHLLNLILYAILILCLYKLLKLLFKTNSHQLIFWICLLYLAHPIHTEVVANIKGLDEILHAIFYLNSLLFLIQYLDKNQLKYGIYSAVFLFCAALSKEMAITALMIYPLTVYVFRNKSLLESIKSSWPAFLALGLYFVIRLSVLDVATFAEKMTPINNAIAASQNFSEKLGTSFGILAYYFRLLIFPHPLCWDYSLPFFKIHQLTEASILLFSVLLVVSICLAVYFVLKKKNKLAYAWLFLLISFSVVSNVFILIGSTLGERFLFLPSLGFSIITVLLIAELFKQFSSNKNKIYLLIIPIAVMYSFKTIDRNADWESNETLFLSALEMSPKSARVYSAVGSVFRQKAENSNLIQERSNWFQQAINYYNESLNAHEPVAEVWYNLGVSYMGLNYSERAKAAFERTLEIDPYYIDALNNLGVLYFNEQRYQEASNYFSQCLKVNPNYASAHANLGAIYHNLAQYDKARSYYQQALRINPNDINTANNLRKLPPQ